MKKRALILAGGGQKVAFQAGVLQVWLDEAGLAFDLHDGASGGTLNLALLCQGRSGAEIAERWRRFDPLKVVDPNWSATLVAGGASLFELGRFREVLIKDWGLELSAVRASSKAATFNVFNFTRQRLEVVEASALTEDLLIAAISLPMWFPPVQIDGEVYIDAVFATDANLEEAIARGADELWIIWTVSTRGEWNAGFAAQYFQIIEASANGLLGRDLDRVARNNAAVARGEHGLWGRHVEVKLLKAEVPLHYLLNFSADRFKEAVEAGIEQARSWCRDQGITLGAAPPAPEPPAAPSTLEFTEEMKGYAVGGAADFEAGYAAGRKARADLNFRLTIEVDDVDRFVTDPDHEAGCRGVVWGAVAGQELEVLGTSRFNLFVDLDDPATKRMRYRLFLGGADGATFTLSGFKVIEDDPGFDLWSDTTTLFTRFYRGHLDAAQEEAAIPLARGILKIHLPDFLRQLTTFRTTGPSFGARAAALGRFGRLFLGKLWDVYGRDVLKTI